MESANIIQALPESKTISILSKVAAMKNAGHNIINLAGGEPDFDTPSSIIKEAERAMESGFTRYANSAGIQELRDEISNKLAKENNAEYAPDEIIVTAGGKPALYVALKSILNPGDEVIVLNPAWVSYEPLITLAGGKAVPIDLDYSNNYKLTKDQLTAVWSERTRAIIVNNPNNPTGRVLTPEEINMLRDFVVSQNLIIIADEVYEKLIYSDHPFTSLASISKLKNHTITVQSFSKTYAMTGWRLGYLALPSIFIPAALKIQAHLATSTPTFIQMAGVTAMKGCASEAESMRASYEKRMNEVADRLNQIPGVTCPYSDGALYVFPEIKFQDYNSLEIASYLLNHAEVAVTPGVAFGPSYTRHVRISCALRDEELKLALERIESALAP